MSEPNASHACYCGELPSGKKCMACQLQTAERSLKELGQKVVIEASGLLELAAEAEKIGATRYAEAYRLIAKRMQTIHKENQ